MRVAHVDCAAAGQREQVASRVRGFESLGLSSLVEPHPIDDHEAPSIQWVASHERLSEVIERGPVDD